VTDTPAIWPSHAYVPGKTARHAEDAFDPLRATAQPGMTAMQLSDCAAFRTGLRYLEAAFYWEAHELLEPVWMALPDPGVERRFVQALIQIANGFLKIRMERPKAAARLVGIAVDLLPEAGQGAVMGIDPGDVRRMVDSLQACVSDAL